MQTNSWVSELLSDSIYSRCLTALVPAELFKVQHNVGHAERHKKKGSSILTDFCLALVSQPWRLSPFMSVLCAFKRIYKDTEA